MTGDERTFAMRVLGIDKHVASGPGVLRTSSAESARPLRHLHTGHDARMLATPASWVALTHSAAFSYLILRLLPRKLSPR